MNFKSLLAIVGLTVGLNGATQAADLAAGEATAGAICAGCHMPDGNSVVDMFPKYDIANVSAFFASKASTPATADDTKVALGKAIYRGGNTSSKLPACMGCHGVNGSGNPAAKFPSLKGQHATYTINQLNAFRDGKRANDSNRMMGNVANKMTSAEIEAVANYIAQMK